MYCSPMTCGYDVLAAKIAAMGEAAVLSIDYPLAPIGNVTTILDAAGVRAAYARGAAEGWESDRLVFWPADLLAACPEHLPLTCVTRAAVECYGLMG